ncbi:MAG: PD-(D/E)XK nuclease family protein [Desulfobulbus sp.]|nr:PD-(D/E)XK nuclease family protein [Desulfobulbus sp.]
MQQTFDLCQGLPFFFDQWRAYSRCTPLEDKLPDFFDELKAALPAATVQSAQKPKARDSLYIVRLQTFFAGLGPLLPYAKHAGFFCDPWSAASLKHNEVRNTTVLEHLGWDCRVSSSCRVRVESHPDGDRSNRVDIEIKDRSFYLIIEVKIYAPEGEKQLQRYCDIALAARRNGVRRCGFIFLTPQGRPPVSGQTNPAGGGRSPEQIIPIPISWKETAALLQAALRQHRECLQTNTIPKQHLSYC